MYKWILNIFNLLLFGNIFIALCAVSLIKSTVEQLALSTDLISYLFLVFFSTLFVYNLQRAFYKKEQINLKTSIRRQWIFNNQPLLKSLVFAGFLGTAISFFNSDKRVLFYLFPLLLLSIAYYLPSVKLRKYPWVKLFTLSFVWTAVTAIIPLLLSHHGAFIYIDAIHILARFCFMCAICIPFDIRDFEIDSNEQVYTLPQLMGLNKAKTIAMAFMLVHIFLVVLEFVLHVFDTTIFLSLLFSAAVTTVLIVFTNEKRNEYYYVFGIDGTMLLQGVLLLLVKHLILHH